MFYVCQWTRAFVEAEKFFFLLKVEEYSSKRN